ncbi:hypothetical protein [Shewanella frigidimarina]|jgi:hypothetical protein|uniref:hypothetical protein n=1 Tax=Shewanella frigidimarina TaxID=56812 RepID=UPI000F4D7DFE|nr:hypothetical protein [Shewanella frigidimarina]RPA23360.1 hypothetical protein EGC78_19550 [Shewanella frigidimarina]RPA57536.1 hypothetical protein EGC86_20200 [Shewanella frigidimarina]
MSNQSLTQKERLLKILSGGRFLTLYEIQQQCFDQFGVHDSETALSARWRELPNSVKQKRRREKCTAWEYRLVA